MGRQYTGKKITRTAEVKQKNGDVYVYERVYQYDRDKKKTVVLSNRLIGKRRAGEGEVVPTGRSEDGAARQEPEELETSADPVQDGTQPDREPLGAAELRNYLESRSGIRQAAELCLPDASCERLLSGLWDVLMQRVSQGNRTATVPSALQAEVHKAHGLMDTLLRLRLEGLGDCRATLIALAARPARVFVRSDSQLLGALELPDMFSLAAGVERVWARAGAGELLLQCTYLETPVHDSAEVRDLMRRTISFVCPLRLDSDSAQRLLTETALTRRQPQTVLEDGSVWAWTFGLDTGDTLEIAQGTDAALQLHIYVAPETRQMEAERFSAQLERLRKLLNEGVPAADLNRPAQEMRRQFLRQQEEGGWVVNQEARKLHEDRLGCAILIANGAREAGEALALQREAADRRAWMARLAAEKQSPDAELLIDMLESSLEALVADARRAPQPPGSTFADQTVSEAAAAYLENASPGELLQMLFGPKPSSPMRGLRLAAVSDRLRWAGRNEKTPVI